MAGGYVLYTGTNYRDLRSDVQQVPRVEQDKDGFESPYLRHSMLIGFKSRD